MSQSYAVRGVTMIVLLGLLGTGAVLAREWYLADDWTTAIARGQYRHASEMLAIAAEEGDWRAATQLGNLFYLGLGVAADPRRAAELYFLAAREGHAAAQLNLGHLYGQGLGLPADPMRAFAWYRMANRYGDPAAEYYLTQISTEYTMSPMQIATAKQRWRGLEQLVEAGL